MTNSRLPCNRLDHFIRRKKEELLRLLDVGSETPGPKHSQRNQKAIHLKRVIAKAKAELEHLEAKLKDACGIKSRLAHLEDEYQACCKRLESELENSNIYRELCAERQRLTPRIQVLKDKLSNANPAFVKESENKTA